VSVQTVREIPDQLPPARLFLDDIDEITKILFEALEATRESVLPVKYKVNDKFICDTLSDLKAFGGAVTQFEVKVGNNRLTLSPYASRWDIWGGGPEIRLATYGKLLRLFEARKMKLKAVIRDLPLWSLVFWYAGLLAAGYWGGAWMVHHRAVVGALLLGMSVAVYYLFSRHSVVEFRYSHEGRSLSEALKSSNPVALAIVAAMAGAVMTVLVERLFKWLWP
jgi:hypothetical protein